MFQNPRASYSPASQAALYYARKNNRARARVQALPQWSAGLTVALGDYVQSFGQAYQAVSLNGATTGGTAPSGNGTAYDGTGNTGVEWLFIYSASLLTQPVFV